MMDRMIWSDDLIDLIRIWLDPVSSHFQIIHIFKTESSNNYQAIFLKKKGKHLLKEKKASFFHAALMLKHEIPKIGPDCNFYQRFYHKEHITKPVKHQKHVKHFPEAKAADMNHYKKPTQEK